MTKSVRKLINIEVKDLSNYIYLEVLVDTRAEAPIVITKASLKRVDEGRLASTLASSRYVSLLP